jgi:cell division protein FtsN
VPAAVKPQVPAEKPAAKVQIAQKPGAEQKEQPSAPEQKPVAMTPPAAEQQPAAKPEPPAPTVQKAVPSQQAAPAQPAQPAKQQATPAQPKDAQKPKESLAGDTFSVHAGSYQTDVLAESEAQRFNKLGLNAYVEKTDLGDKGIWYRVKIGRFNSREEGKKAEAAIHRRLKGIETRVIRNK